MDTQASIQRLRRGETLEWPSNSHTLNFAQQLDHDDSLVSLRDEFIIPTRSDLKRGHLLDDYTPSESSTSTDASIYFCGNSLGLQPKAVSKYLSSYLQTWNTIAVGGHFTQLENSPLTPFQDMAADCAKKSADIFGAAPEEVVIMNTLTVNLHMMMAAFYRPEGRRNKIMIEWRPFPSDWYAVESQIEWHGLVPKDCMVPVEPDKGYTISTKHVNSLIDKHADELALILLPGIQYYSGQLLDIPAITAHARSKGILIGWDLAHAAGNVELKLHEWDVDFACWCNYKYMNGGAGGIAGTFIHSKHGDVVQNKGLKGWYGGDKSVRFLMDNKFVPTPGAQGFQCSNPSMVDLSCLSASLSVFNKTSMSALRSKSLLLTAYAEKLLLSILSRRSNAFEIITPSDPRERGAQLCLLLREELLDPVIKKFEASGIICDKRKPGVIRVAPAPLYNTFTDVWRFMEAFEMAIVPETQKSDTKASSSEFVAQL